MKGLGEWVAKLKELESQSLLQILISFTITQAAEECGTVRVILSVSPCKHDNARFREVPCKVLLDQV